VHFGRPALHCGKVELYGIEVDGNFATVPEPRGEQLPRSAAPLR
jgi:hypothetical protein